MSDDERAIAEQLCERWFDTGARASWCPKMVDEFAQALRDERRRAWEEAAKLAENSFPYAATDEERFAHYQTLRIAEQCRHQAEEE